MGYGKAEGRAAVVDWGIGVLTGEAWTEPRQELLRGRTWLRN